MANLTVDGDSNYTTSGTPDTFTPASNGPSGTDIIAEQINGIATAITELQALLGDATVLKGSVADLVTRLSRVISADGALAKGTSFPGTPIDGQPFYRTDLNTFYVYDAGTTSWTIALDSGVFALADGSRDFTGDIKIRKSQPAVRLKGLETSAEDILIREDAGVLYFYRNTGSEGTPTWTEFFNINTTTGALTTLLTQLTGSGAFKAIFSHANTANRTYSLPNYNWNFLAGLLYCGPTTIGAGSTRSLETFSSATGNLSGIHFYDGAFTLDSGHTLTVPAGKKRLIIISNTSITINGTITAAGAGGAGGTASTGSGGGAGAPGTDQPGGGGGNGTDTGGYGGGILAHGIIITQAANDTAGTQLTASDVSLSLPPFNAFGGSGGGGGGSSGTPGAGGAGGGSIVLIAPVITLSNTAVLNTSGSNGTAGAGGGGNGGGGGAGNIYIACRSYTDNGATFTQTGGGTGAAGAAGVKQILLYG